MAALKTYELGGKTFQYVEGEQPAAAVEVTASTPANKGRRPATK